MAVERPALARGPIQRGSAVNLTETEDYPTSTLPARADALMERMIAGGMSALGPDDYETIYQALEAACEVIKTKEAIVVVRKQLGLSG